jgi:two-component system, LuxR family, sensor histidine kinase TtrS
MKTLGTVFKLVLICVAFFASLSAKEQIYVGVLAHKQFEATHDMWNPTVEYLNEVIPDVEFHIVPLRFEEFPSQLSQKKINFVIVNSAYYVDLEHRFGISRIATLKNKDFNGRAQTEFGGVVFTRSSSSNIRSLEEIAHHAFAAVNEDSFGGWIMALREFKARNIDPKELQVTFYGTHEAVVHAVLEGKADAGTVRTDTLERMAAEGKITMDDISVLNPKNYPNFYYQVSTRLYPEWPIATTKHTSDALAERVAVALISMPSDTDAARASNALGWTIPLDYQSIHECLKELHLGPYTLLDQDLYAYVIQKYGVYFVMALLLLIVSVVVALYILSINVRLRETRKELQELNATLEERVREKTHHLIEKSNQLEEAYQNEKYLRTILRTVADVNQILITAHSVSELIDKSTLSLSSNESLMNAKISILKEGTLSVAAAHGLGGEKRVCAIEERAFREGVNQMITDKEDPLLFEGNNAHGIKAVYALPLKSSTFSEEVLGVLSISTARVGGFSIEEQNMIEELSGDIGFALNSFMQQEQIMHLHEEQVKSYENFIDALVNMIEQRDTYTAGHTYRVAHYAQLIAKELELSEKEIEKLVASAKLHDIGKVVTPDSILLKPGKLTKLEYELIKEHAQAGYEVLSTVHMYQELADIMIDHHERYDGSGYPKGKKGGEISMLGHIMAVADSFDAMTTNRIYRPRKEIAESLAELNELSGKWYHPAVVDAANKVLADITIDTSIDQIGSSLLEEERLSYFFKDRLTKLYNEDYLMMTLSGRSRHPKPQTVTMISFMNFHHYNKMHGWEKGNVLMIRFADYLLESFPETLLFRVWGDRFILADFEGDPEKLIENSPLAAEGVAGEINVIEVVGNNLEELMRVRG